MDQFLRVTRGSRKETEAKLTDYKTQQRYPSLYFSPSGKCLLPEINNTTFYSLRQLKKYHVLYVAIPTFLRHRSLFQLIFLQHFVHVTNNSFTILQLFLYIYLSSNYIQNSLNWNLYFNCF